MAYYYPEGYFGPICDAPATAEDIAFRNRLSPVELEIRTDERVYVYPNDGDIGEPWWEELEQTLGFIPTALKSIRCKQAPDGTYYDCIYQYITDEFTPEQPQTPNELIGLRDNFIFPDFTPQSCSPFDPDINILPKKVFLADGTEVLRYKREKSSPVTFDVSAGSRYVVLDAGLNVQFDSTGTSLIATGSGSANTVLRLKWNDDPSSAGTAVDTITIVDSNNVSTTWTQSGEKGEQTEIIGLSAGTYNLTFTGLHPANNPINVKDGIKLKLKDGDSDDTNCSFEIMDATNQEFGYEEYQWNEDGRKYGVWVNPAVCTLPAITQEVTYSIDIEEDGVYGFSFGTDNRGTLVLNESDILFNDIGAGIFDTWATVAQSTPHTTTRTLQRGTILLTVSCLNVPNEVDADGNPTGASYRWSDNPGGWFIKICKGGACVSNNAIADWFPSGPTPAWSTFMNTYAVFPSVSDTLVGIPQTAIWNINVPDTDDYILKYSADNTATLKLDGSTIGTHAGFNSSTTTTLTGLTVGAHTIEATVTNAAQPANVTNNWAKNPAGVAWTITRPASSTQEVVTTTNIVPNDIDAEFNSDGDIVVTGVGGGFIQLIFEWDDDPSRYGTALGQINIAGKTFTQITGKERGSDAYQFEATAGTTYPITISNNPNGFRRKDDNHRLCFMDADDDDCNAKLTISGIAVYKAGVSSTTSENVTTVVDESVIASSLDLSTALDSSNIVWHTRMASGYEYYLI